jgi:hypothetical protein
MLTPGTTWLEDSRSGSRSFFALAQFLPRLFAQSYILNHTNENT